MLFDYFYAEQAESYSFYRIPKLLFTEEVFSELSSEAKILYGLIMDRISLSRENGWIDQDGHVYVYYTVSNVEKALNCCKNTACKLLKELEDFGLIEREKQGLCKPAIIYVKNFIPVQKMVSRSTKISTSGVAKNGTQEYQEINSINTNNKNTEINNTNPIISDAIVDNFGIDTDMEERNTYLVLLNEQLDIEGLKINHPFDKETIEAIRDLMLDVICSKQAKKYCHELVNAGYLPLCPILAFNGIISEEDPDGEKKRREMSGDLLRRARFLVVCGKKSNDDVRADISLAKHFKVIPTTLEGVLECGE